MIYDGMAVVTNTGDDTLSFIDVANRKNTGNIDLRKSINNKKRNTFIMDDGFMGPYDIVCNNKGYLYCTNIYDNSISKIDMASKEIIDKLYVGRFPTYIRCFSNRIFISNSDSNSISIIDEKTFSLVESITVGEKPVDIEIDKKHMRLYISNSNSHNISVVDVIGSKNNIIRLNHNPIKIILEDKYMYVLSIINNGMDNKSNISIINNKGYKIEKSIDFNGILNTMFKIDSSKVIFITGIENGYIYKMDINSGDILDKIYLGGMPNRLAWNGGNVLLITNLLTNLLTLFDINNNKLIDNIRVGQEPNSVLTFN